MPLRRVDEGKEEGKHEENCLRIREAQNERRAKGGLGSDLGFFRLFLAERHRFARRCRRRFLQVLPKARENPEGEPRQIRRARTLQNEEDRGVREDEGRDAEVDGEEDEEEEDVSLKQLDDSYFTETLARIYVKQKRYDKALQIIKNLSLKYPEKNIYFADQIRFLEKLIINTKK